MTKDDEIEMLCAALNKAHTLFSVILTEPKREDGSIVLSAEMLKDCADWCENEFAADQSDQQ
jgi:hypothetical protein